MKAVQLSRIDVSVEKYVDRIWNLTHSKNYQKIDRSKWKEILRRDSKEQFHEVNNYGISK